MKIKYYRDLGGCNTQVWVLGLYKLSWPAYGSYVYVTFYFFLKNFLFLLYYYYYIYIFCFVLFCFLLLFFGGEGKGEGERSSFGEREVERLHAYKTEDIR